MGVKLEISGNYLKWTDGSNNPGRYPYRDVRFYANDANEYIELFNHLLNGKLTGRILYSDEPAEGSVTIDTTSATHATGSVTMASVVANTFSTGTVTLASAVANTFSTGTAQCTSVIAGDEVVINGLTYTAVDGAKTDNTEFSADTGDNECAADLADSVNNDVRVGTLGIVSASPTTDTVTLTSDQLGTAGDPTTLTQTGGTITLSGATFSGGVNADTVVANDLTYTAISGTKADNTEFDISGTDIQAAADLVDSINNDVRVGTLGVITSANGGTAVVTMTSDQLGIAGDATTLTSSDGTRLAVSGAVFSGGVDADYFIVDGRTFTAVAGAKADNTEFSIDTDDDAAATDLADSINNDVRVGTVPDTVTASATTDTVTITSMLGGTIGNATTLSSSNGTRLAVSGAVFTGGLNDAEVSGILVNSVEIMSGAEVEGDYPDALATAVAANITAFTSTPNYTATAVGSAITIVAADEDTNVNGFVVATTIVKGTKTDVNMAGATASILDSTGDPFDTWAALVTWLEKNTGGELIA